MSSYYLISPFEGDLSEYVGIWEAIERSTLNIDPEEYRRLLADRWQKEWSDVWIRGPDKGSLLVWQLYLYPTWHRSGHGRLSKDHKTVSLSVFHTEFILWHRSVIPPEHRLVLYAHTTDRFIELTQATSADEVTAAI